MPTYNYIIRILFPYYFYVLQLTTHIPTCKIVASINFCCPRATATYNDNYNYSYNMDNNNRENNNNCNNNSATHVLTRMR